MEKLVVFDVDGVLIDTKIGSFKEMGILIGKEKEIKEHAEEYERRKHLGPWGLDELAMIFKGIEEKKAKKAAKEILDKQLMLGTEETINELLKRRYKIVSYSSSPIYIMQALREKFSFVDICGNTLEVKNGIITGKLLEKVDRYAKAERLEKFIAENKISKENLFIIGDSITDLPLSELGRFIAFNSDNQEVREKAEFVVDKKDLREVLRLID